MRSQIINKERVGEDDIDEERVRKGNKKPKVITRERGLTVCIVHVKTKQKMMTKLRYSIEIHYG